MAGLNYRVGYALTPKPVPFRIEENKCNAVPYSSYHLNGRNSVFQEQRSFEIDQL